MKGEIQEQEERQMVTFRKRWGLTQGGQEVQKTVLTKVGDEQKFFPEEEVQGEAMTTDGL
jgi:hypothetical protein